MESSGRPGTSLRIPAVPWSLLPGNLYRHPHHKKGQGVTIQMTEPQELELDDRGLDVTIVESGPAADRLIRMTYDGGNSAATEVAAAVGM